MVIILSLHYTHRICSMLFYHLSQFKKQEPFPTICTLNSHSIKPLHFLIHSRFFSNKQPFKFPLLNPIHSLHQCSEFTVTSGITWNRVWNIAYASSDPLSIPNTSYTCFPLSNNRSIENEDPSRTYQFYVSIMFLPLLPTPRRFSLYSLAFPDESARLHSDIRSDRPWLPQRHKRTSLSTELTFPTLPWSSS